MGFSLETGIPVLAVFVQGLLSFFSPCVLPLVPLYLGYLAGGSAQVREDGTIDYPRKTVLVNTVFFVAGVSFAILFAGIRLHGARARVHGQPARVLHGGRPDHGGVRPVHAGRVRQGARGGNRAAAAFPPRSPCHEPAGGAGAGLHVQLRVDAVRRAGAGKRAAHGVVERVGGLWAMRWWACMRWASCCRFWRWVRSRARCCGFFRTHGNVVKYTVKVGGALLIVMGVMTLTGWMNGVTSYLSSFGGADAAIEQERDAGDGAGRGWGRRRGHEWRCGRRRGRRCERQRGLGRGVAEAMPRGATGDDGAGGGSAGRRRRGRRPRASTAGPTWC